MRSFKINENIHKKEGGSYYVVSANKAEIYTESFIRPFSSSRTVVSYWRKDVRLVLVNCLESLSRNSVVRLTDRLDMIIVVDWDVKTQIKQTKTLHLFHYVYGSHENFA